MQPELSPSGSHELRSVSPYSSRQLTVDGALPGTDGHDIGDTLIQGYDPAYHSIEASDEIQQSQALKSSFYSRLIAESWTLEIVAWIFASTALVILIIVLAHFNGKPLSRWHSGISVNTLINILTTISSLALVFPVASSIAQMRWIWLQENRRPLADMETFGSGPIEIFNMLRYHTTMPLAYFAALNVLLIIVFSPITQATLDLPIRQHVLDGETASVATNQAYSIANPPNHHVYTTDQDSFDGMAQFLSVARPMEAAINNAIVQKPADPSEVSATCSTGNCIFPIYSTLGVCSQIQDVSSTIVKNSHSEPTGPSVRYFYSVKDIVQNPTWRRDNFTKYDPKNTLWVGASVVLAGGTYPNPDSLGDFYVIYLPNTTALDAFDDKDITKDLVALKGSLNLCIRSYQTTVTNGITYTVEQDRVTNLTWKNVQKPLDSHTQTPAISTTFQGTEYWITQSSGYAFKQYFSYEIFHGAGSYGIGGELGSTDMAATLSVLLVNQKNGMDNLSKMLDNLAVSMTNVLRTTSDNKATASGKTLGPETYIKVNFHWLILPIISVVFAFLFLVIVILQSAYRGTPAWKSSQLKPLLSLDQSAAEALAASSSQSIWAAEKSLRAQSKEVQVKLEQGNKGAWQLFS